MDGPQDYHTEWNKSEKNKCYMILLICGILKKVQMNVSTRQSHKCRKQTYGYQGVRLGGGIHWEIGIDINTLLYIWKSESISHSVVSASVIPWIVDCQVPLSMEFSRQEYWSRLPFPAPGYLPDPGMEPRSPALQADSLPTELQGKLHQIFILMYFSINY